MRDRNCPTPRDIGRPQGGLLQMSAVAFLQERTLCATEIAQHRETLIAHRVGSYR